MSRPRRACLAAIAWAALALAPVPALAAPPGPGDLARSIETARKGIADYERTLSAYDVEMRALIANDPAAARRREEIRILKQHYVREIEGLKNRITDDYRKIQEFKARGVQ
ncbi:MAG: hypothetical protein AAGU21_03250 [Solidesulfovibrio sp.]|uniref:hypothetical protein n=1 Tax=Solidesulfovibrio sp. TaxID=2910990 RepID=UPI002B1E9783|nr:hypothetical protein [Solidesulfovibrio sp.]MEA4856625.1 hypothetical protein [Solidesulfovibrio sp.]